VICGPQTGSEGSLMESAREKGISVTIEPALVREINPLKDLLATWRLVRFMRRGRFTIVHTHSSKAGILGRWAAWTAGTPIIIHTVHGWGHNDRQRPIVKWLFINLERLSLRITDRLTAPSPLNVEKGLKDNIGHESDYVVIREGIELDQFGHPEKTREETRSALGIPLDTPLVGTVTRLSPQKAPADFIKAAGTILEHEPQTRFVVVGDGPMRQEVQTLAENIGLKNAMTFTGLRRDVPDLMAAFDIFVLCSLWEGLPRVLPQAMATGLPIVATDIDGNSEAVKNGLNGILVPTNNSGAIAEAVLSLIQKKEMAKAMGAAGREHVAEFGDRRMVRQIEELYLDLIKKKGLA